MLVGESSFYISGPIPFMNNMAQGNGGDLIVVRDTHKIVDEKGAWANRRDVADRESLHLQGTKPAFSFRTWKVFPGGFTETVTTAPRAWLAK